MVDIQANKEGTFWAPSLCLKFSFLRIKKVSLKKQYDPVFQSSLHTQNLDLNKGCLTRQKN